MRRLSLRDNPDHVFVGQVGVVLSLQKCQADRIPYGIHQQFGARVIRELQCDAVRRGPGYGRRFDIG